MESQQAHSILIVEDDPIWQTNLQIVCEAAGYQVIVTTDASAALHQSERLQPPPLLALVDLELLSSAVQPSPYEDGFEVLTALRERGIYVVVVSGNIHHVRASLVGRPEICDLIDKHHFSQPGFAEGAFLTTLRNAIAFAEAAQRAEGQLPTQQARLYNTPAQ